MNAPIDAKMLTAISALRSAAAVRERCGLVHRYVAEGQSPHFSLDESRLDHVAAYVADVTRQAYPDLAIPVHSRWRHFDAGNIARWETLTDKFDDVSERARAAIDLATVSVLLDAGAGDAWRYREAASGLVFTRSEGLAVASFDLFKAGGFSSDPRQPWRADAEGLMRIDVMTLGRALQVGPDNPLVGLEARADLLNRLGRALAARPDLFGSAPARPGNLLTHLGASGETELPAPKLLTALLDGFSTIWPSALTLGGMPVGDAGRHPAIRTGDTTVSIVPFHKLSQWLTYSLIEPFTEAGCRVTQVEQLTALPEYRNGGLLIDLGVIVPRAAIDPAQRHAVSSELVVEWRALTVALMDRLLVPVRKQLSRGADFLLPHMLQGGTWTAGRRVAMERRPPAGPSPIPLAADATVF